ncbi:virion core protein / unknown function [Squirrelpox virus]|uniref:Uncharacterized protein n=1 Tax=Squirrelpox virus TaxID=240426 RepID=U3UBI9_9POXV|nr:virion core protein / unknown function [Squirrelpox virus]CCD83256.1 virion core protein / unknown function [Squirrelpox virus]
MSMDLFVEKTSARLARRAIFPTDVRRLAEARCLAVERRPDGAPSAVHLYESAARFDNHSIFQVAKFLFRHRPAVLRALFPCEDIMRSFATLEPDDTLEVRGGDEPRAEADAVTRVDTKMALVELANAFYTGGPPGRLPYYYRPLSVDAALGYRLENTYTT